MTRIQMVRKVFICIFLCIDVGLFGVQTPDQIWHSLKKGNTHFVEDHIYEKQRRRVVDCQNPHSIILSCSDSRVPPELIFDKGIGKLFTVRVAGEVVDYVVLDSVEYAVEHFETGVIVVMGHTNCGAVTSALARLKENHGVVDDKSHSHLVDLLLPIEKAIVEAGINIYDPNALQASIRANVRYVATQLIMRSPEIAEKVEKGHLKIIGAEYNLATGKVKQLFVID